MKPAARAQGKGIFLFRKLQDITAWRRVRKSIRIECYHFLPRGSI